MKTLIIVLALATSVLAQDKPKLIPPSIPAELERDYFQADGALAKATPAWQELNNDLNAAATAVRKFCEDKGFVAAPQGKRLACIEKPTPAPEAKK